MLSQSDFDITNNTDLVANLFIRKQRTFTENEIYPYAEMNDLKTEVIENLDRYDDRDDIRCNLIESYDRLSR